MREVVLPVRSGTNAPLQIIKLNQKSLATKLLLESSFRQRQPEKKKGGEREKGKARRVWHHHDHQAYLLHANHVKVEIFVKHLNRIYHHCRKHFLMIQRSDAMPSE